VWLCAVRAAAAVRPAFEIQAEGGHSRVVAENLDQILDGEPTLIAHGEQVTDRHRAVVETQTERDGAALADQGNAALERLAHDLIGQHRRAIEEIHESVAVRAEEGQFAGLLEELAIQPASDFRAELAEARAEAHEPARAARGERPGHRRRLVIRHGDESRIGDARQLGDGAIERPFGRGRARGMHAPHGTAVADRGVAGRHRVGPDARTDERNAARRDQTADVGGLHGA
jgi:hypothetical protein